MVRWKISLRFYWLMFLKLLLLVVASSFEVMASAGNDVIHGKISLWFELIWILTMSGRGRGAGGAEELLDGALQGPDRGGYDARLSCLWARQGREAWGIISLELFVMSCWHSEALGWYLWQDLIVPKRMMLLQWSFSFIFLCTLLNSLVVADDMIWISFDKSRT